MAKVFCQVMRVYLERYILSELAISRHVYFQDEAGKKLI